LQSAWSIHLGFRPHYNSPPEEIPKHFSFKKLSQVKNVKNNNKKDMRRYGASSESVTLHDLYLPPISCILPPRQFSHGIEDIFFFSCSCTLKNRRSKSLTLPSEQISDY
jgi:hypothetical protein